MYYFVQGLQHNNASKVNEFTLLGVNVEEENVFKSFVIGFVNSSFDVDDHCPYNLIFCGIAGKAEQIENIHGFFNNVCNINYFCVISDISKC